MQQDYRPESATEYIASLCTDLAYALKDKEARTWLVSRLDDPERKHLRSEFATLASEITAAVPDTAESLTQVLNRAGTTRATVEIISSAAAASSAYPLAGTTAGKVLAAAVTIVGLHGLVAWHTTVYADVLPWLDGRGHPGRTAAESYLNVFANMVAHLQEINDLSSHNDSHSTEHFEGISDDEVARLENIRRVIRSAALGEPHSSEHEV